MSKHVYGSKKLHALKKAQWGALLIPIGVIIFGIGKNDLIHQFSEGISSGDSFEEKAFFVLGAALCILIESLIPIIIYKVIVKSLYKSALKKETFKSLEEIEYYRDKMPELSPTDISMLCDLKVEYEKDLTAVYLSLEDKGYLKFDESTREYQYYQDAQKPISEVEAYVLKCVRDNNSVSRKTFIEIAETEATKKGLVSMVATKAERKRKQTAEQATGAIMASGGLCFMGCLAPVIAVFAAVGLTIAIAYVVPSLNPQTTINMFSDEERLMDSIDDGVSLYEFTKMCKTDPALKDEFTQDVILCMSFLVLMGLLIGWYWSFFVRCFNQSWYKRTALGEQYATYVWAMRNFIRDFSLLSEAERSQIVLWNEFLTYAVLTEQNEKVIREVLMKRREY